MRSLLCSCLCLLTFLCSAEPKPEQGPPPLWSSHLLDWEKPPSARGVFAGVFFSPPALEGRSPGIVFLDNNHLVVHELNATGQLSTRDDSHGSSAFILHTLIVDAKSGEVLLAKDLPTRPERILEHPSTSVQAVAGGVVVRTGRILLLFSPELKELQTLTLPQDNPNETWIVSVSPTGRTVLLNGYDRQSSHFSVLDGSTLATRTSWAGPPLRHSYSISDSAIVAADTKQEYFGITLFGTNSWKTIYGQANKAGCIQTPTFITDRLIANAGCGLALVNVDGESLMKVNPEKQQSIQPKIADARAGAVFGFASTFGTGGGLWDIDTRISSVNITAYNTLLRKSILSLRLDPLPKQYYDFAFSPDGSKLAILTDGNVTVYKLEAASTTATPSR